MSKPDYYIDLGVGDEAEQFGACLKAGGPIWKFARVPSSTVPNEKKWCILRLWFENDDNSGVWMQ